MKSENRTITGYNCDALSNVNRHFLFGYSVTLLLIFLAGMFALIALYCILLRIIYKQESFRKRNRSTIRFLGVSVHHGSENNIIKESGSTNFADADYSVDKSESYNTAMESKTTSNQKEGTNGGFDVPGHMSTSPSAIHTRRTSKLIRIFSRIKRKH